MAANVLLALAGIVLATMTLRDVFDTVVIPGGSRASLRVAQRLGSLLLPLWKAVRGRHHGISGSFAPVVLLGSFVIWLALLALAFGLMAYAARASFQPRLEGLPEAIYTAGSAMTTVGPGKAETVLGIGRWILLGAGFCGLAVMTMAVTYLLQVQSSIAQRDTGIIKLNTSAGDPPSALTLLERLASLKNADRIREVLVESRNWVATTRQSHSAHPTLIYFQSIGIGAGWPAALGAVLDLALIAEHLIDDESLFGASVLLRDEGIRMSRDLARLAGVDPKTAETSESELKQLANRLETSGYQLRRNPSFAAMNTQRAEYQAYVQAIAERLGKPAAVLVRQG
ncbi:MAG: hypothetical protein JOZ20_06855 [Sphingomonas sp.]|nr:hypothetical protein [Sphingomonas sp.]MBW0008457.1 hypothetical protein [Sphingomonas sp.]